MIDVAVIGGGFSGTLLAVNLVRHDGPAATIFERGPLPGRGLAYATASRVHLLNVRAANMSALPDDPGHFEQWARQNCAADRSSFVARADYGRYLDALFEAAAAEAPHRIALERDEVLAISRDRDGFRLKLGSGATAAARRVVLATGNLAARTPQRIDAAALGDRYAADPWRADLGAGHDPDAPVVLIGSGLTAIDVALRLVEAGQRAPIVAISRHGLLPRVHGAPEPVPPLADPPPPDVRAILRHLRQAHREIGWRAAIDQLRPHSQLLWRKMPLAEKRRFLRHARAWWDVHRHRMAPEVAAKLEALQTQGRFRSVVGRILAADRSGEGIELMLQRRDGAAERIGAGRLINCTGPGDIAGSDQPLILCLLHSGLARPDPLGMGLDTDADGRVLDRGGQAAANLFAVGPLTRGSFWEMTAVPDIRRQVWSLARLLSNAHWVGGEGL